MLEPSTECIWGCGRSNFNREHVLGRQFANALDLPHPIVMRWGSYGRTGRELEVVVENRVCMGCNGRWMKKLDDDVKDILGSSITGAAPVTLTSGRQKTVARWALKVGLLLMLWTHDECEKHPELLTDIQAREGREHDEPYVPLDDYQWVGQRHEPPDDTAIWLGSWPADDALPPYFSSVSALSHPTPDGPERLGYYVLFVVGRLAVYVLSASGEVSDGLAQILGGFHPSGMAADIWVPIWPMSDSAVNWPPLRELTSADVEASTGSPAGWAEGAPPAEVEPEST